MVKKENHKGNRLQILQMFKTTHPRIDLPVFPLHTSNRARMTRKTRRIPPL
jgi:hypothetical protein